MTIVTAATAETSTKLFSHFIITTVRRKKDGKLFLTVLISAACKL